MTDAIEAKRKIQYSSMKRKNAPIASESLPSDLILQTLLRVDCAASGMKDYP